VGFHELRTWDPLTGGIYSFPLSRNGTIDAHSFEKAKNATMRGRKSGSRAFATMERLRPPGAETRGRQQETSRARSRCMAKTPFTAS